LPHCDGTCLYGTVRRSEQPASSTLLCKIRQQQFQSALVPYLQYVDTPAPVRPRKLRRRQRASDRGPTVARPRPRDHGGDGGQDRDRGRGCGQDCDATADGDGDGDGRWGCPADAYSTVQRALCVVRGAWCGARCRAVRGGARRGATALPLLCSHAVLYRAVHRVPHCAVRCVSLSDVLGSWADLCLELLRDPTSHHPCPRSADGPALACRLLLLPLESRLGGRFASPNRFTLLQQRPC
jgi:hypothetical protein